MALKTHRRLERCSCTVPARGRAQEEHEAIPLLPAAVSGVRIIKASLISSRHLATPTSPDTRKRPPRQALLQTQSPSISVVAPHQAFKCFEEDFARVWLPAAASMQMPGY